MVNLSNILVFLGPPGCGKGSLASYFLREEDCFQLSTGNLCRKYASLNTSLGKEIDFLLKSGKLISDELILDMVKQELNSLNNETLILDGFPRTEYQALIFNKFLQELNVKFNVVRFEISEDLVVSRLSNRLVCTNIECQAVYSLSKSSEFRPSNEEECSKCKFSLKKRSDDQIDIIKSRYRDYSQKEKSVLDFYKKVNQPILNVDASLSSNKLFNEVKKIISK